MILQFIEWTTHLNKTNNIAFAFVTVGIMAAVGIGLALLIEIIFKILGVKTEKTEEHF